MDQRVGCKGEQHPTGQEAENEGGDVEMHGGAAEWHVDLTEFRHGHAEGVAEPEPELVLGDADEGFGEWIADEAGQHGEGNVGATSGSECRSHERLPGHGHHREKASDGDGGGHAVAAGLPESAIEQSPADGLPPLAVPEPPVSDQAMDLSNQSKVANFPFPRRHVESSALLGEESMAIGEDRMKLVLLTWLDVESPHAAAACGPIR